MIIWFTLEPGGEGYASAGVTEGGQEEKLKMNNKGTTIAGHLNRVLN